MRIIVYYIIYMQSSINLININNIHVLSHYCCIFGLNVITLWPPGLYIYVFLAYMEATLIN